MIILLPWLEWRRAVQIHEEVLTRWTKKIAGTRIDRSHLIIKAREAIARITEGETQDVRH